MDTAASKLKELLALKRPDHLLAKRVAAAMNLTVDDAGLVVGPDMMHCTKENGEPYEFQFGSVVIVCLSFNFMDERREALAAAQEAIKT